jgi:hypothetical protein
MRWLTPTLLKNKNKKIPIINTTAISLIPPMPKEKRWRGGKGDSDKVPTLAGLRFFQKIEWFT